MRATLFTSVIIALVLLNIVSCANDDFYSSTYNALSRNDKFNKIWARVTENRDPYGWYNIISQGKIMLESMSPSFDWLSDSFISDRNKYIHSVGVVGRVEFIANPDKTINPYTGVFKGCSHVIMRLSCAKEPNENMKDPEGAKDNFTPGFGIKFLRDQVHSGNTVAMFSVNGQSSWNFFKNDFSNHISSPEGVQLKLLEIKFRTATSYTGKAGLMDMAFFDQNGNSDEDTLNFPYKLIFRPTNDVQSRFTDYFSNNFLLQLISIETDTVLYDVLAQADPYSPSTNIGQLVLKDRFTTSQWGDKSLFFRHGYFDNDVKLHPEWKPANSALFGTEEFQKEFKETFGFFHP